MQIASILALVQDSAVRLLVDAGGATELSPDTNVVPVIRAVVNWSFVKVLLSATFQTAVKGAAQKCRTEPPILNDVADCTIDVSAFTVPAVIIVETEVQKRFIEKDRVDNFKIVSIKVFVGHRTKPEDKFLLYKMDLVTCTIPRADLSDKKRKTEVVQYLSVFA